MENMYKVYLTHGKQKMGCELFYDKEKAIKYGEEQLQRCNVLGQKYWELEIKEF